MAVKVFHQHAELCPPVTDVVLPDDSVTRELEHATDGVAEGGTSQVSHMHFFGDVGAGKIDDDAFWCVDLLNRKTRLVCVDFEKLFSKETSGPLAY